MRSVPYDKISVLNSAHWVVESYAQRLSTKDWKRVLLNNDDTVTFQGRVRKLVAKNLGFGVVEVSKETKT